MIPTAIGLLALTVGAVPTSNPRSTAGPGLLIKTSSGPIGGFFNHTALIPQTKKPNGTFDAVALPNSCMQQFDSNSSTVYTEYEQGFLISGGNSEDCLYLSIWAPRLENIKSQQRPLPVLLYIPGGGFTSGGQASLYKIPDQWVQRTQSHIVVIMNYRVNVFGFPNAKGLKDQNVGLVDQRLAVEWVNDNIANFGGDPQRITLWGQSAGGGNVAVYAYGYPDNPIVAGLIADSGGPGIVSGVDTAQTNFTFLAGLVGCNGLGPEEELSCVRKVPAQTLENALSYYSGNDTSPSLSFKPVVDEKTGFLNWTQRILDGKIARTPMIIGSNSNEGAGFVSFTPEGPGQQALDTATKIISCPVAAESKSRNLGNLPTYRYEYAGTFTNISPLPWFGAYHSAELPLLFGTHSQYGGPSTPFEWEVSYAMEALWLSFAEDPTRGPVRLALGDVAENPDKGSYFDWPLFQQGGASDMLLVAEGDRLM
ncbi:Alpha/Beta hydrolase protein [Aspergillus cavernicola]|uniref:Carboxylic ester hydrolase n=1 Tax=Aspergillus cavernicola TaxID=176166 RepID=A0ABR4HC68_9EURO